MAGICNKHPWPQDESDNGCNECRIAVCDFCRASPTYEYPCDDFVTEVLGVRKDGSLVKADPPQGSAGAWAACQSCHDFIEADDWDSLAERTLAADWADPELR